MSSCAANDFDPFPPPGLSRFLCSRADFFGGDTAAASGLGSGNQAIGEGSTGGAGQRQGVDSKAGGREMNDKDASIKGDTVRTLSALLRLDE